MVNDPCTITIPCRHSYVAVWEPVAMKDDKSGDEKKKKYQDSAIIDPSDKATIKKINAAVEAAIKVGIEKKWGNKKPTKIDMPLHDGDVDRPTDSAYAGMVFLSCKADRQPGIVDNTGDQIMRQEDFYSGCYGFVNITMYPYLASGKAGVAVALNHVMKTKDDEPLGGTRISAEEAFADVLGGGTAKTAGSAKSKMNSLM